MSHASRARELVVLVVVPALAVSMMYVAPFGWLAWRSMHADSALGTDGTWVGLRNYADLWNARLLGPFLASTIFALASVTVQMAFALASALLTWRQPRSRGLAPLLLILPYFIPSIVIAIAFRMLTDPFVGPLPLMLGWAGAPRIDFRGPGAALPMMVAVSAYEAFPFAYAFLAARLAQIPDSLLEIARISGAPPGLIARTILWPHVRPVFWTLVLIRCLMTWMKFDVPWIVYASQAPSRWGDTLAIALYRTGFEELRWGRASAVAIATTVLLGVATIAWQRGSVGRRREVES